MMTLNVISILGKALNKVLSGAYHKEYYTINIIICTRELNRDLLHTCNCTILNYNYSETKIIHTMSCILYAAAQVIHKKKKKKKKTTKI